MEVVGESDGGVVDEVKAKVEAQRRGGLDLAGVGEGRLRDCLEGS